jgi:hydroxyacyl-ACP dehydratase HTD2-like protein with hotdog domain
VENKVERTSGSNAAAPETVIVEEQMYAYRSENLTASPASNASAARTNSTTATTLQPPLASTHRRVTPTDVTLIRYSALTFNVCFLASHCRIWC